MSEKKVAMEKVAIYLCHPGFTSQNRSAFRILIAEQDLLHIHWLLTNVMEARFNKDKNLYELPSRENFALALEKIADYV